MGKFRRIKSKTKKGKLSPIPHNNRKVADGHRLVRAQIIVYKHPDNPDKKPTSTLWFDGTNWYPTMLKKTVFHWNLTPSEEQHMGLMKKSLDSKDPEVMKKLTPRERKMYDVMVKLKEKENAEKEKNDDNKS